MDRLNPFIGKITFTGQYKRKMDEVQENTYTNKKDIIDRIYSQFKNAIENQDDKQLSSLLADYNGQISEIMNYKSGDSQTILHIACKHGVPNIVKILLNSIDKQTVSETVNKDGYTAIEVAAIAGRIEVVELLLHSSKNYRKSLTELTNFVKEKIEKEKENIFF